MGSIFKIGQKVVCVSENPEWRIFYSVPRKDKIYTIKNFYIDCCNETNLCFCEIDNNTWCDIHNKHILGYSSFRFRPLITDHSKADIKDVKIDIIEEKKEVTTKELV